jgi:hypothetical protein
MRNLPSRNSEAQPPVAKSQGEPPQPRYEYHMIQAPSNFAFNAKEVQGGEIANYVQEWANRMASDGWEFYRIDNMSMTVAPGCLSALFGAKHEYVQYSILTFRRLVR